MIAKVDVGIEVAVILIVAHVLNACLHVDVVVVFIHVA
jgi:hypothetical protein